MSKAKSLKIKLLRLGVNIDHVATIRNARGGVHPSPIVAAKLAEREGADGITAHLREDRRHISDEDIKQLKKQIKIPLNLEMAATPEMLKIALKTKPNAVCLVPEKRKEITTEGGLDVFGLQKELKPFIAKLRAAKIRVSLFIEADDKQIEAAKKLGADIVELHTGAYAHGKKGELERIIKGAEFAEKIGLECHAGHGLNYDNVKPIAKIPQITELNIGHFLIGEAIFIGLENSIRKMQGIIYQARKK